MAEKILFEMRIDDEDHPQVYMAPEWRAYHRKPGARQPQDRPAAERVRQTLDSLQRLYDDLYK